MALSTVDVSNVRIVAAAVVAIAQRILDTSLIICNAILAQLFEPEDLRSLLVVKLSELDPNPRDLSNGEFEID